MIFRSPASRQLAVTYRFFGAFRFLATFTGAISRGPPMIVVMSVALVAGFIVSAMLGLFLAAKWWVLNLR
jgi:hypothetical protein